MREAKPLPSGLSQQENFDTFLDMQPRNKCDRQEREFPKMRSQKN
ncbi:hypothetical protein [Stanieria cyanosphaera]|nr:hypothetical protein [Stanieria cyanosphaera]